MNHSKSTSNSILRRIRGHGRGWIFTISEFLDLGAESALKKTLSRLCGDGTIRRLTRGIYDYPRIHKKLGILSPNPDDVAAALAASTGSRLQISGGRAANLLGLTTQVPAQLVYLTDGPPRRVKIAGQTIQLRSARPSKFPGTGTPAGLAIQAMRAVGPKVNRNPPSSGGGIMFGGSHGMKPGTASIENSLLEANGRDPYKAVQSILDEYLRNI